MWKALLIQFLKLGLLASLIVASVMLTHRIGPVAAGAVMCAGMGVVCGMIAVLFRRTPMGRVTLINYVAAIFLPFGYFIGKGKLAPIVITSWIAWTIVGAASALAAARGYDPRVVSADGQRHVTASLVLLIVAWIVDGEAILYLSRTVAKRLNVRSAAARKLFRMMAVLAVLIAASAILWSHGLNALALLVAGGPPLFVGGLYGAYFAFVLIAKPRWN
jgi:hypothetical protein